MWKKAAPAISVAFLALMTLKFENIVICAQSTLNDHNDMKKLSRFDFSNSWPLIWPFQPLLAFYNFLESLAPKKTSGMQKCHI